MTGIAAPPPRIVFLHENPHRMGGGEEVLLRVAAIAAGVAELHFAGLIAGPEPLPPDFAAAFVRTAQFDFPLRLRGRSAPKFIACSRALASHLRHLDARAAIAFSYPAAFRMALALRGSRTRLLWVSNLALGVPGTLRRLRRILALRVIAAAGTTVVCSSRFSARELLRLGYPRAQVRLVRNGVDLDRFAPGAMDEAARQVFRRSRGIPEADLVVACVARIDPIKNHSLLLRALAIARREGVRVALACVGGVDPRDAGYALGLREEARALGVEDCVLWAGRAEDVSPWLAAADAAALASHSEAGALALVEAAAAGLPLAASRVGANPEIVLPGHTGFLFDAHDAEGCARAMIQLARDGAERRRLGLAARAHVAKRFGLERSTRRWTKIIADLVEGREEDGA
jgi:glycosyltransferase involved in cell wall biosynthesis